MLTGWLIEHYANFVSNAYFIYLLHYSPDQHWSCHEIHFLISLPKHMLWVVGTQKIYFTYQTVLITEQ